MATSLLALLSQQTPNLQTRKGLILLGLQNDFLSPDGKLPVSTSLGFLDRLKELVPAFREYGDIIWVRSNFKENRDVNRGDASSDNVIVGSTAPHEEKQTTAEDEDRDGSPVPSKKARMSSEATGQPAKLEDLIKRIETGQLGLTEMYEDAEDEELFLSETPKKEACCIPDSFGAEYDPLIKDMIDARKDMQLIKTSYSAFASTSLLLTLRSKLITELFICGCCTNLSIFATAMDAARYGIKITLIEDCLGYRQQERHDLAIKQLREIMGAEVIKSEEVIDVLKNPPQSPEADDEDGVDDDEDADVAVGEDAGGMSSNLLEPDDNDGEDDTVPPIVRPPTLSGRMLELRNTSSSIKSLLEAAKAERKPTSSIEPPEPCSPRDTNPSASSASIGDSRPSIQSSARSGHGEGATHLERWLASSAGVDGLVTTDESSKEVKQKETWGEFIDSIWAKPTENTHKPSACSSHPGLAAISTLAGLDQATVNDYESRMEEARRSSGTLDVPIHEGKPLFGEDKQQESAGSQILYELLPRDLAETIFDKLNAEISWQRMLHQTGEVPRLVCCQGTIGDDGSMPVYRHPSDQTPLTQRWTPFVDRVRRAAEEVVGHPLNHALIQLYRGGTDYISEHSDKTLDIVKDTCVVNVSFGARRTLRLRTKRAAIATDEGLISARTTYRVPMPHNSMVTMSLATNAEYLHGINADKRPAVEFNDAETAFGGQRISLTFRNIGTFLDEDCKRIWGQGAVKKTKGDANPVINADMEESEKLIRAFGTENQSSKIDWDVLYGHGFDVLHIR